MKLGTTSPNFTPNGDSSTKLDNQVPVTLSFINKDASDMMGSGTGAVVTYEQVINIFNTYIANTNLAALLDVDDLLDAAPEGSILTKGATEWTYETLSEYLLPIATVSTLGGVKIGNNISVDVNGVISTYDPYEYWTLGAGFTEEVKYGLLYNWYAATDSRNIANTGWHLPSYAEYSTMRTYIGSSNAYDLLETGDIYWMTAPGTNIRKFNARGVGRRLFEGFNSITTTCQFWTSLAVNSYNSYAMRLQYNLMNFPVDNVSNFYGCSIRLLKDSTSLLDGQSGTYTGNDGKVYRTICIGTQEWLADNLCETKYRNGDSIAEVTSNSEWASLTTGALCAYNNDWSNVLTQVGTTTNIDRHELLNIKGGSGVSISLVDNDLTISATGGVETDPIFTAWDKSTGISITESQISDFGSYISVETDPIFLASPAYGITSGMISTWNSYTSYTHPTQSAINPTLTGANVLASLSVNTLGHVTAATSRVLTLANLGFVDGNYVHIAGSETITGAKTFSAATTAFQQITANSSTGGLAVDASSNYVAVQGYSTGGSGYGVVGLSSYIPVQGTSLNTTASGRRLGLVLNGDSAHTSVANEYAIDVRWDMPWLGDSFNKPAAWQTAVWTSTTLNAENSRFEWRTRNGGAEYLGMSLFHDGKLKVKSLNLDSGTTNKYLFLDANKDVTFVNAPTTAFTLTLPNAASVAGRCSAAVEGTNYPTGWTIQAWSGNPKDLLIVHGLGLRIAYVSVFTVNGTSERQLFNNAAYSGIIAPDQASLRIESLATIATDIVIHLFFA